MENTPSSSLPQEENAAAEITNAVRDELAGSSKRSCRAYWERSEDEKLVGLVEKYGEGRWSLLAKEMPARTAKQCSERWHNNLHPNIKRNSVWSEGEERIIIEQYERIGKKWSAIAKCLSGRPGIAIRNHWNSTMKKVQSGRRRIARLNDQSTLLEDYMRNKFSDAPSCPSSSSTAAPINTAPITLNDDVIENQMNSLRKLYWSMANYNYSENPANIS